MPNLSALGWLLRHPLNENRKIGALADWLAWQGSARLLGRRRYRWIDGLKLATGPGDHGFTPNIATGLAEFETMGFVLHYLCPGDLFIDVGANVGSYSLLASLCGAQILAAEPSPLAREAFLENLKLNGIAAEVIDKAITASDGDVTMELSRSPASRITVKGESVKATTLDAIARGRQPALVKIDVEGHESAVLDGAPETLKALPALIIESWGDRSLRQRLAAQGLQRCRYDPFTRKIESLADGAKGSQTEIFLRDPDALLPRLAAAKKRCIKGQMI